MKRTVNPDRCRDITLNFYRDPWNAEKVDYLRQWWPHFGTIVIAEELSMSRQQIKSKTNSLRLLLLPKSERLCAICRTKKQKNRYCGIRCIDCHLARRKQMRRETPRSLRQWVGEITNTARHRSPKPSNLTTDYMIRLWNKQKGKCFYSGLELIQPVYGAGRIPLSPSIDRVNPGQGYVKGNVVWAAWICNVGKSDLLAHEYFTVCVAVAQQQRQQQKKVNMRAGIEQLGQRHGK